MVNCYILGCKSYSDRKLDNVTFHSFPKDSATRQLWTRATGRKNWGPTKYMRICSIHFDQNCFRKTLHNRTYLKPFSVPKLHIVEWSHEENLDTERDERQYEEVNYDQTGDSEHVEWKTEIEIEQEPGTSSNEQSTWHKPSITRKPIRAKAGPKQVHSSNDIKEEPIDIDELEIFGNLESNSKDIQSNAIKEEPADELEIFGKYVVEQLNSLEEDAVLAQEEIREVLAKYQLRRRRKHEAIFEESQFEQSQMMTEESECPIENCSESEIVILKCEPDSD